MTRARLSTKLLLPSFLMAIVAGCGGGGSKISLPGGSTPISPSSPATQPVSAHFSVDVKSGLVTVTKSTASPSTRTIFTGTTVGFTSSTLFDLPGNVGTKQLSVSITNNSGLTLGTDPNGNTNGLNAVFTNFANVGTYPDVRPLTTVSTFATGFKNAWGVVAAGNGVFYVADTYHNQIKKVSNGVVSLLAGTGVAGDADGSAGFATFNLPIGIAINPVDGALIVTEQTGAKIRRVTLAGQVNTIAGTGAAGAANGTGAAATFSGLRGVTIDPIGIIYVAESGNFDVRKITFNGSTPTVAANYAVTTLAGGTYGFADGTGTAAHFHVCDGIAYMNGNLYVADSGSGAIRQVTPSGLVTTIAGNGTAGINDGAGNVATFNQPAGIVALNGALIVSEGIASGAMNIRQVTPISGASQNTSAGWQTSTLAGTGVLGNSDGTGSVATFSTPQLLTADKSGNVYVADSGNSTIREISPNSGVFPVGVPSTGTPSTELVQLSNPTANLVGPNGTTAVPYINYSGSLANGGTSTPQNWWFIVPNGVTAFEFDVTVQAAPQGLIGQGGQIGKGDPSEIVSTLAGSDTYPGFLNGPGTEARFNDPQGMAMDKLGELIVADSSNHSLRLVSPKGFVSTIAGNPSVSSASDGTGDIAGVPTPYGVAVSSDGNTVYFGDNSAVRIAQFTGGNRTDPASWTVSTIAGSVNISGDNDGNGATATFTAIYGLTVDSAGNIFVADSSNNCIRLLQKTGGDISIPQHWLVRTFAGSTSGQVGFQSGTGTSALFSHPASICIDPSGNLYVADLGNYAIRKVTPDAVVTTFAGSTQGYSDGASPKFSFPAGIGIDSSGYLYVSDASENCVRRLSPSGYATTIAGGPQGYGYVDGPGNVAKFAIPVPVAVSPSGDIFVADEAGAIRLIQKQLNVGAN